MKDDMDHRVPLDIETGSAEGLYGRPAPDPSWIKLVGLGEATYSAVPGLTPDLRQVPTATVNGNLFDFPALDRHYGVPVEQTIPYSRDLRTAAFQHDPPTTYQTSPGPGFKSYSMDALCLRYLDGDVRKSDIGKELAKEYGGWDLIDPTDTRFSDYLRLDLERTRQLDAAIPYDPYEQREAWVATVTARTTLNGFAADVPGLQARSAALTERAAAGRALLAERYGFPLTTSTGAPSAAPQRTAAGKAAFEAALRDLGVDLSHWPRGKKGDLALGKEVLETVAAALGAVSHPALALVEAVQDMNGIRNSAANILRHVTDGRAYYTFEPFQSTGRWSCGLTVIKKGTADSERMFLTADPGEVLVSVDLDQIDIRGAAAHAQDPALISLLNDPARDIHTEISQMARVPRKQGKTFDLGWLYGRSARAMGEMKGADPQAAQAVVQYMATAFPLVRPWQQRVREQGEAGVLLDNGFGRRLRVDPQRAYTQAPAMVGQSTTRDIIAEGLLDIARRAPEVLPMLRVIVHDEVVLSVPARHAEEIARTVQACMSRTWAPAGCSVPVDITAGQGKPFVFAERWGSLYL